MKFVHILRIIIYIPAVVTKMNANLNFALSPTSPSLGSTSSTSSPSSLQAVTSSMTSLFSVTNAPACPNEPTAIQEISSHKVEKCEVACAYYCRLNSNCTYFRYSSEEGHHANCRLYESGNVTGSNLIPDSNSTCFLLRQAILRSVNRPIQLLNTNLLLEQNLEKLINLCYERTTTTITDTTSIVTAKFFNIFTATATINDRKTISNTNDTTDATDTAATDTTTVITATTTTTTAKTTAATTTATVATAIRTTTKYTYYDCGFANPCPYSQPDYQKFQTIFSNMYVYCKSNTTAGCGYLTCSYNEVFNETKQTCVKQW
ncbi:hypothetical protein HELRODRAFT_176907 [Helobdella robusta]|uniref:Uncharacterized protein n=1 Tax=Helobdella robusta TaxID=6412 RepID=T1FB15_HELRO|nr:hypothetical protein HELRODRAFT_176907 [Helobdella robusta]ESN98437.1 hypothetical protein HELRODRAFT_176907 [Helobdella robusta]